MRAASIALALVLASACRPYVIRGSPVLPRPPPRSGAPVAVRFRSGHPDDGYTLVAEHAAGVSSCQTPCTLTLPRGGALLRLSGARRFSQAVDIERAATWRIHDHGRERRPIAVSGLVFGGIGVAVGLGLLLNDLSASLSCSLSHRRCDDPALGLPTILGSVVGGLFMAAIGFAGDDDRVEIEPEPSPVRASPVAPPPQPSATPESTSDPISRGDALRIDRW